MPTPTALLRASTLVALALLVSAAQTKEPNPLAQSGGILTSYFFDANAYSVPAAMLSAQETQRFALGRESFDQRWVVTPQLGGPWGLGPTANGDKCTVCHEGNGRGQLPEQGTQELRSLLVRLSVPGTNTHGGPKPTANYGEQLNTIATPNAAMREGRVRVTFSSREVMFGDGDKIQLRVPQVHIDELTFGALEKETMTSARLAPPLVGLGLLEAIPEQTLHELAKNQIARGVSGRVNTVWDIAAKREVAGRFGLKANQPNIRQQVAAAFHGDLGVTSEYFPDENCPDIQAECKSIPSGGKPELTTRTLDAIQFYLSTLTVPARRHLDDPEVQLGERLFTKANCDACHIPELQTGELATLPAASRQTIRPYTDLLLHDMGEELADGRPDYQADGREWRTAPLWGVGLSAKVNGSAALLHDGRARNVTEAILWHGGEASSARENFCVLSNAQRQALVKFVESL